MLIIECPEGKLYPVSSIILNSVGLGLCNILFNNWFSIVIIAKLENIDIPIFLSFININKTIVNITKNIAPPKLVINFAIGVTKSDIRNFEIMLYNFVFWRT